MKISYLSLHNPYDIHKWSGSIFFIAKALENQNAELDYIGNFPRRKIDRLKQFSYNLIQKRYIYQRTISFAQHFSNKALQLIKPDTDIIFSPGSIAVSLLNSKVPKVFYTDATFAGMIDFYQKYTKLPTEIIEQGNCLEQKALDSSALAIYSSDWAAQTAIEHYNVDPRKIKVVPFGANIECNRNFDDIKNLVAYRSDRKCNLLFIGVEWERKGGNIALNVAIELNKLGLNTTLHIVGIKNLKVKKLPDFVINHGFLSKTSVEGKTKLEKLFKESHFLIVPSRAEAFGLVFCEASSFGLPSLATNVGGITTVIKDDINGKTFDLDSEKNVYVDYILSQFQNRDSYRELSYSSFNEYQKRLNWNVAGKSILNLIKEI